MRRFVIVLLFTVIYFPGMAQLNNKMFEWPRVYADSDSGRFYAGFRTMGFLRNNEYFQEIEGYTRFGYQVNPFLAWQAGRHLRIEGGVYLSQWFGEDGPEEILPTFSFIYQKRDHQLIFGTLQGNLSHRLIEPLYDFETILGTYRLEYGFQYRLEKENLFLDTWIDWRNAIDYGDREQEELLAGISSAYRLLGSGNAGMSALGQLTAFHRGGQINLSGQPVSTIYNGAFGIKGWSELPGFLKYVSADMYYVFFTDNSGTNLLPADQGDGFYANLFLESEWNLGLMLSYWQAEDYYSPAGGPLYLNYILVPGAPVDTVKRNLLFIRLLYDSTLSDDLRLGIRGEPYVNLDRGELEWSLGLYLVYDVQFRLGNRK